MKLRKMIEGLEPPASVRRDCNEITDYLDGICAFLEWPTEYLFQYLFVAGLFYRSTLEPEARRALDRWMEEVQSGTYLEGFDPFGGDASATEEDGSEDPPPEEPGP